MWWKCEVLFCRNVLRLKVWARNEGDARKKVERMYQLATIRNLAPADSSAAAPGEILEAARQLSESVVPGSLPQLGEEPGLG
jgi:hypothetical protein